MQDSIITTTIDESSNSPIAQEIAGKVIGAIAENQPPIDDIGTMHIALAVCGALLYNLVRLDKLRKQNKKFKFMDWLSENYISLIISAISLVVMFLLRTELKDIMGFDMSNRFGCFWAGFTAHSLISLLKGVALDRGLKNATHDDGSSGGSSTSTTSNPQ